MINSQIDDQVPRLVAYNVLPSLRVTRKKEKAACNWLCSSDKVHSVHFNGIENKNKVKNAMPYDTNEFIWDGSNKLSKAFRKEGSEVKRQL